MGTYLNVSQNELYRQLNAELVHQSNIEDGDHLIDLGCGTGSLSQIVLSDAGKAVAIWAVDPDEGMVGSCRSLLGERVGIIQAGAENFGEFFPPSCVDVVLMGNAIHLVDDIPAAMQNISRVLKGGGHFGFNTAFHDRAFDKANRSLALELVMEGRRNAFRINPGLEWAIGRRGSANRALNREFYQGALTEVGFEQAGDFRLVTHLLSADLLKKIVVTPVFATGALPAVGEDVAIEAMSVAADTVFARRASELENGIRHAWLYGLWRKPVDD